MAASFSISVCAGYGGLSYLRGEYSATHTTKSYNTKTAPFLKSSRWLSYATLPSGTVGQWESAHIFNKKATAAGWALSVPKIQNHVRNSGSLDALKPFAEELTICVDEAAAGEQYWDTEIRELAVSCMVSMGWQHPDHEIME